MLGMKNTHNVSVQTMIQHGISVKSNVKKAICVIDMPANSYKNSKQAKRNANGAFLGPSNGLGQNHEKREHGDDTQGVAQHPFHFQKILKM